MDDLGLSADSVGASSIFTGDEEVFAFARAVVSPTLSLSRVELMRCGMVESFVGDGKCSMVSIGSTSSTSRSRNQRRLYPLSSATLEVGFVAIGQ